MVLGVGIDLIETARVRRTVNRFGERFFGRVFTEDEISYCKSMKHPDRHFAARFAAKEAVSKCFGTGIGRELGWKDVEIVRDRRGKPGVKLHGNGRALARRMKVKRVLVSLSHTEMYGSAVAVIES
jgi:holo-[acyl-carrier protein] synthase